MKNNLQPHEGMSAAKSTIQQRAAFVAKFTEEPTGDCVQYGFYMGEFWEGLIPDYTGDKVKKEINLNDMKPKKTPETESEIITNPVPLKTAAVNLPKSTQRPPYQTRNNSKTK